MIGNYRCKNSASFLKAVFQFFMLDSESINHTFFIKKNNNWYNYIALTSFQPTKLYSFQNSGSVFLNFSQIWASMLFYKIFSYMKEECVWGVTTWPALQSRKASYFGIMWYLTKTHQTLTLIRTIKKLPVLDSQCISWLHGDLTLWNVLTWVSNYLVWSFASLRSRGSKGGQRRKGRRREGGALLFISSQLNFGPVFSCQSSGS